MAFYHGKTTRIELVDKLVQLLTTAPVGSAEPYWKKVSSGTFLNEGYILKSSGKTGGQDIYIRIHSVPETNYVKVTTLESYIPNDTMGLTGTITNESSVATVYYHSVVYNAAFPVEYHLSFDRDKIILALTGDKGINGETHTGLLWVGMPQRLDPDGDTTNNAVCIACSKSATDIASTSGTWSNVGRCRTIRDRQGTANALSSMITVGTKFNRSKGWGDEIMLPDIYIQDYDGVEGIRSIMDGVHPLYQNGAYPDFKSGDEVVKNSKRYTILQVAYDAASGTQAVYSTNAFPSQWMAIEQLL